MEGREGLPFLFDVESWKIREKKNLLPIRFQISIKNILLPIPVSGGVFVVYLILHFGLL